MRGATWSFQLILSTVCDFNPRSSCEERRGIRSRAGTAKANFNPRSSCEERLLAVVPLLTVVDFNPRSSCEERQTPQSASSGNADFNPRSSCEERRKPALRRLRAGADFNPRSSCEERHQVIHLKWRRGKFQSTLLMRGATGQIEPAEIVDFLFQSTLLMRGATVLPDAWHRQHRISIHAPHARSDQQRLNEEFKLTKFQSTLLMRGATACHFADC